MLNRLQQMFVLEYLADPQRNAKAALIRAGYSPNGRRARASQARWREKENRQRGVLSQNRHL